MFYLQQFGSTPFKLGVWNGNPNDTPFFFEPELPKGGEDIRLAPGMTGDRGRLFMTFQRMEGITEIARGIAAYDVTKNPPTLLGAVDLERSQLPLFQLDIVDDRTLVQISFRVSG